MGGDGLQILALELQGSLPEQFQTPSEHSGLNAN